MRTAPAVAIVMALTACGDDGPGAGSGLTTTVVADGFAGPTQIAIAPDGDWIVAELNGGERDGSGRILRVDADDPDRREVLLEGLLTPTGVAVSDDQLWVMEQRRLTVGPLDGSTPRRVVAADLPFNGRSQGALTPSPGGGVVYDTSGALRDGELVAGSGALWRVSIDGEPERIASGFKHAYATAPDGDGRWWVTEIGDGRLDDEIPPDELNGVRVGDDGGYPICVGDRIPVAEVGGTADGCDATLRPHALFAPRATPTSVVVAPWDAGTLLVALWVDGTVVAVPTAPPGPDGAPHRPEVVVDDLDGPQHLVVAADSVLLTEFGTGRVLRLGPP